MRPTELFPAEAAAVRVGDRTRHVWPGLLAWLVCWLLMIGLDGRLDLANLAMLLLLGSAVASFWLPLAWALAGHAVSLLAFNWVFVPPRGEFSVDLQQHTLLLVALVVVNTIIALLIHAQRQRAEQATEQGRRAELLRQWGDALRDGADHRALVEAFCERLSQLVGRPGEPASAAFLLRDALPPIDDASALVQHGQPDGDQTAGLWLCLRLGQALGRGAGRQADLPEWYLPLRTRQSCMGAAMVRPTAAGVDDAGLRQTAQLMADQLGMALERARAADGERRAQAVANDHAMRSALLAAVSHDYRTPLATIMGAASSMLEQADRLDAAAYARLARRIVDEAARLNRMTANTLQLARLDGSAVEPACDWESAEDLIGAAVARARQHDAHRRLRTRIIAPLPLLWCDAMLMAQMLDNLIDNAFKHGSSDTPVELLARSANGCVVLAVRDRGPGVGPAWRERVFDAFERGAGATSAGMGIGLAVCRAIAQVHGAQLTLRARAHGGASFEFWLPVRDQPEPGP